MPRRTLIRSLFCPPLAGWPEQQIRDIIHVGLCPPLAGVATRQRVAGGGFQPRNAVRFERGHVVAPRTALGTCPRSCPHPYNHESRRNSRQERHPTQIDPVLLVSPAGGGGFQPRNFARGSSTPFGLGALRCGWSLGCAPGSNWTPFRGLRRPVLVVCGSPSRVLRGFKSMQRLAWHLA